MKELFPSFQGTEMAKSDSWDLKCVPLKGNVGVDREGMFVELLSQRTGNMTVWGLRKTGTNEHLKFSSCSSW